MFVLFFRNSYFLLYDKVLRICYEFEDDFFQFFTYIKESNQAFILLIRNLYLLLKTEGHGFAKNTF